MKILPNVRRAPTRRMLVATPTFLRGGALETESPGHYLNLPAGTSSPFSPGSEISGRRVVQALPDHRVAGRRPQLGDHPAALEGGPGSRKPDRLEVLHRGRRGIAGSAGGEWQPEGGRELSGGTPTTAELAPTDCGWERSSWSRELLAREMARRTGVRVSRSTLGT